MKRRLISALLTVVMLLCMIPAVGASAEEVTLKTSEKAIALLKEIEGFSAKAYADNGQYSIGYGTACSKNQYPNGITESKADALMREALAGMEVYLDKFIKKYALNLSQTQYDALMMFTYNVGAGWTTTDSDFRTAVINGYTGNAFIYYIARWCTSGGSLSTSLVKRRLAEADLYLYGYYAAVAPSNYSYVCFDGNGGTSASAVQGYDACDPTEIMAIAENTGCRFMGWYTKAEGGEWVSHLDKTTKGITLYAHWQQDEGNVDESGNILGTDVHYTRITTVDQKAYDAPSVTAEEMDQVPAQTTVTIVADYVDGNGIKWGMLEDYSWIDLTTTTVTTKADTEPVRPVEEEEEEKPDEETLSIQVTVTGNSVNFRSGPGTSYTKLGTMNSGKQLMITEVKQVGNDKWGKFSYGWICLTYTNYDAVIAAQGDKNSAETVIATGTVVDCNSLRIRSGAGTNYDVVGNLACGTKVNIYQIVTNGSMKWGRIASGWISLNYVKLSDVQQPSDEKPSGDDTADSAVVGTVTATRLNVRSGAGTKYSVVGTLEYGQTVTVTEQTSVSGAAWGKIESGWICMSYVKITGSVPKEEKPAEPEKEEEAKEPDRNEEDDASTENVITGKITATVLRIRSGAGTNFDTVGSLTKGETVTITEQKLTGGMTWGKIESGWICMSYVSVLSGSTDLECTGMVTASALTIRSAAGTSNAVVGRYVRGTVVTIFEISYVGSTPWGHTDKGWICMDYVSY